MHHEGMLAAQFLKLRCRDEVSPEEEEALVQACGGVKKFAARETIVPAKVLQTQSHLLLEGLVCRSIDLPDGRRQIVALHVPGDFVDLHSFLLQELEHDVEAMTSVKVARFPHANLKSITETQPHLARLLWLSTLIDAALHREWAASLGRRSAVERIAHLLCELYYRLKVVDLVDGNEFSLPLTQTDLGDACGLTAVHVSRTLRELREDGLAQVRSRRVRIDDLEGLQARASFDPFYLQMTARPR
jgi:CRP-like cAMP-binding protein